MKKVTPLLIITAVLAFASCKKESVAPAAPSVKLKTISDLKDVGTWDNGDSIPAGEGSSLRAASTTTTTSTPAAKTKKPKKK